MHSKYRIVSSQCAITSRFGPFKRFPFTTWEMRVVVILMHGHYYFRRIDYCCPLDSSSINHCVIPRGTTDRKRRDISPKSTREDKVIDARRGVTLTMLDYIGTKQLCPTRLKSEWLYHIDIPPASYHQEGAFTMDDTLYSPHEIVRENDVSINIAEYWICGLILSLFKNTAYQRRTVFVTSDIWNVLHIKIGCNRRCSPFPSEKN